MTPTQFLTAAALIAVALVTPHSAQADNDVFPGLKRTSLMKQDLSVPGREVVLVLVEFPPGLSAQRHAHPGEEIVYVVEGELEYALDGRPPIVVKAGEVLFIPHGTPHAVKNVSVGKSAELGTYIAEKGRPLLVLSE